MADLEKIANSKALFVNPSSDPEDMFRSVLILEGSLNIANAFGFAIKEHLTNVLAIVCSDPQKCLSLVPELYFDCLVCDMDKPELEGAKVINEFQSRLSPTTSVVACTSDMKNEALWKDKCEPDCVYHRSDKFNAEDLKEFAGMIKECLSIAHQRRIEACGYDIDKGL
jgi:CheY-like chemotaxis protein